MEHTFTYTLYYALSITFKV